ncbi:MAG: Uma2 family endonuclease [Lachnospiraceae bacterium]|nr:Uma2 family endonuclease [Lachnospiraceae bacterium]
MAIRHEQIYTVEEFYARGEDKREELIDGFIYDMATPNRRHQGILMQLASRIANHIRETGKDCVVYPAPFGVKLSKNKDNVVEPDISVICDKEKLNDRGCEGAPDWIVEIVSPTNPGHDYVLKLNLYEEAGVREYWIVDPTTERVLVYHLDKEQFRCTQYTFADTIPVMICEGFQIDFKEIDNES